MTENQKLREAIKRLLKAHRITVQAPPKTITDAENQIAEIQNAVKFAEEALALPTADHIPDAGEMVVDHLPDAGKMIETAAPVGELPELPEAYGYFDIRGSAADGYTADQMRAYARAALRAGDAVDAQMYRWLMDNCTLGIKQNGVGWSLNTTACIAPDCIKDVGATIDAAMRKGQL